MAVSVKRKKNILKIEVPLEEPALSKSGKTYVVASSHGVITTSVMYKGQPIVLVLNAFIYQTEDDLSLRAQASMRRMRKEDTNGK